MTPDEYLKTVLTKYTIANGSALQATDIAYDLVPYIKDWAGEYLASLNYSGSYAKKTAIAGEADLDLLISLTSTTPYTLKEIYTSLFKYLTDKSFTPQKQKVSIGITYRGLRVDLVPAKRQGQQGNDHSLYMSKKSSWIKTNVHQHITLVSNSLRIQEIQLIKIWRRNRSLDFPSFYLELVVLHALNNQPVGQLGNNVLKVLTYLTNEFVNARFVDPANSSNVISNELTKQEKQLIATHAEFSLTATTWDQVVT